tara:strand:- start:8649 stop:8912 length:264 start_codon:yes stop_codon:yes gene_type:complete
MSIFVFLQIYEMNLQKNFTLKLMSRKIKQKNIFLWLMNFKVNYLNKLPTEIPKELKAVLMSNYDAYQIFELLSKEKQRSIIYGTIRF